jgi:exodeoxyribonuclease VII small subunit
VRAVSRNKGNTGSDPGSGHEPAGDHPVDFESAVAQIEKIIERIESGEIGLEESIAQYEKGVGLIRRCRLVLDRAEQRVEELTGQMQEDAAREAARGKSSGGASGAVDDQEPSF